MSSKIGTFKKGVDGNFIRTEEICMNIGHFTSPDKVISQTLCVS
jgi:hypothetical protein